MSKIAHNNKKLSIEVKAVKDDNQFLLARMQSLSKTSCYCRIGD